MKSIFKITVVVTAALFVAVSCDICRFGVEEVPEAPSVTGIEISSAAATVKVDSTVTLSYTVKPAGAKVDSAVWSTSAESVAKVNRQGVVTGVAAGTATITVTVNGTFTKTCTLTVEESDPVIYTEGSYSGKGIKVAGIWWAPVNCGYDAVDYPYGKLYQWGRKSGQGYGDPDMDYPGKSGGSQSFSTGPIASSAEEASVFYKISSSPFDWLSTPDNTRWNIGSGSSPSKNSNYDPCPAGWRVPTESELNALISTKEWTTTGGLSSGQSGYLFGTSPDQVFLPAAGSRDNSDGNVNYRGSGGIYWTSSVSGNYAKYLYFYNGGVATLSSSRAHGCSVRCVRA